MPLSALYRSLVALLIIFCTGASAQTPAPAVARQQHAATQPADAMAPSAEPLPHPIYVASQIDGTILIDGKLTEPIWRQTALGWGLSHAHEPNLLCPDPTLFRIAYNDTALYLCLAAYQRPAPPELPDHVWKPRESAYMDMQAVPRHARERGYAAPINTVQVLLSSNGRTLTLTFTPPAVSQTSAQAATRPAEERTGRAAATVHDALGQRDWKMNPEFAFDGAEDDPLWTCEARIPWAELGFDRPAHGADWALNLYREIRFLSNWSFIAWMRDWDKAEYSRYDLTDRFGRLLFAGPAPQAERIEAFARDQAARRGPVRLFTTESLLLAGGPEGMLHQRYAEWLEVLRAYAGGLRHQRGRIGSDLPYAPFFTEKEPRPHLKAAARRISDLYDAMREPPLFDDAASAVARISHAIPEAREGLFTYKKERLYRGLPE